MGLLSYALGSKKPQVLKSFLLVMSTSLPNSASFPESQELGLRASQHERK